MDYRKTAAGEGHQRSLLSYSPLGWGRLGRSVGDENTKICGNFWLWLKGRQPRPPKFRKEFVETLAGAMSHGPHTLYCSFLSSAESTLLVCGVKAQAVTLRRHPAPVCL